MSPRSETARRASALRALLRTLRTDVGLLAHRERVLQEMLENQEVAKAILPSLARVRSQRRRAQADLHTVAGKLEALDVRLAEPAKEETA